MSDTPDRLLQMVKLGRKVRSTRALAAKILDDGEPHEIQIEQWLDTIIDHLTGIETQMYLLLGCTVLKADETGHLWADETGDVS